MFVITKYKDNHESLLSFLLQTRCSMTALIACVHGVGYDTEIGKRKHVSELAFYK